jgi:hypothetical protein
MSLATRQPLHSTDYGQADVDATPVEIATAPVDITAFQADNRDNTDANWLKVWDRATAPSVGTHKPDMIFKIPAGKRRLCLLNAGHKHTFASGCYIAMVASKGWTGSTSPTNATPVRTWA